MSSPFDYADDFAAQPGAVGDVARNLLANPPGVTETPTQASARIYRDTQQAASIQRQQSNAKATVQRIRGADLAARDIPTYKDESGDVQPVMDETGAPLTQYDKRNKIAWDSSGKPRKLQYGASGPPELPDPFADLTPTTDPKTGYKYRITPGLPWQDAGQDDDIVAANERKEKEKALKQAAADMGGKLTLEHAILKDTQHEADKSLKQVKAILDPDGTKKVALPDPNGSTEADYHKAIDDHFAAKAKENASRGFLWMGPGEDEKATAQKQREAQREAARQAATNAFALKAKADTQSKIVAQQHQDKLAVQKRQLNLANGLDEEGNAPLYTMQDGKPVIDPMRPADAMRKLQADGRYQPTEDELAQADVMQSQQQATAAAKDGQKLYAVGDDGQIDFGAKGQHAAALDQAAQDGLIAPPTDEQRTAAVGMQNYAAAQRGEKPYKLTPEGKLQISDEHPFTDLTAAVADGIIAQPDEQTLAAAQQKQQLVAEAGSNPALKAAIYGLGRGAAFLSAAPVGAGIAAEALAPFEAVPYAGQLIHLGGTALAGIATGTAGAMAYDKLVKTVGQYNDTINSFVASAETRPGWASAGEIGTFAAGLPRALMKGAGRLVQRGANATAAASEVGGEAVETSAALRGTLKAAKETGQPISEDLASRASRYLDAIASHYQGSGGGLVATVQNFRKLGSIATEQGLTKSQIAAKIAGDTLVSSAAMAAVDTGIKEVQYQTGMSDERQTWGGAGVAAFLGATMAGHGYTFPDYSPEQVGDIFFRAAAHRKTGVGLDTKVPIEVLAQQLGIDDSATAQRLSHPLTPEEQEIFNALGEKVLQRLNAGDAIDGNTIIATARQALKSGRKTGIRSVKLEGGEAPAAEVPEPPLGLPGPEGRQLPPEPAAPAPPKPADIEGEFTKQEEPAPQPAPAPEDFSELLQSGRELFPAEEDPTPSAATPSTDAVRALQEATADLAENPTPGTPEHEAAKARYVAARQAYDAPSSPPAPSTGSAPASTATTPAETPVEESGPQDTTVGASTQPEPITLAPHVEDALRAAEERAAAGDHAGARNALNRVYEGMLNESEEPPDGVTPEEWAAQRASNQRKNAELIRRAKDIEGRIAPPNPAEAPPSDQPISQTPTGQDKEVTQNENPPTPQQSGSAPNPQAPAGIPGAPHRAPARDKVSKPVASEFAKQVQSAAASVDRAKETYAGAGTKAYISAVYRKFTEQTGSNLSLEEFKRELTASNGRMEVELRRQDMSDRDAREKALREESRIHHGGEDYHFVTVEQKPTDKPKPTPRPAAKVTAQQALDTTRAIEKRLGAGIEIGKTSNPSGVQFKDGRIIVEPAKAASSMTTVADNQQRAGIEGTPEEWLETAIKEEIDHKGQELFAKSKGQTLSQFYTAFPGDSLPDGWEDAVRKARGETEFAKMHEWQRKAEFVRMVMQKKWLGKITEALYRHIQEILNYLGMVAEKGSKYLRDHIADVRKFVEGLEREGRGPPEKTPTKRPTTHGAFHEEPIVQVLVEHGGLLSRSQARKKLGAESYERNKGEWDDVEPMASPAHNAIYKATGLQPDEAVSVLVEAGLLPTDSHAPDLWKALGQASRGAASRRAQEGAANRQEADQAKMDKAFAKDSQQKSKGEKSLTSWDLNVGDTVLIGGEHMKVVAEDAESVTLEDGHKYGRQQLEVGKHVVGRVIEDVPEAKPPENLPHLRSGEKGTAELFQQADQPFNLAGETGVDDERVQREKEAAERAKSDAKALEEKQQTQMFHPEQKKSADKTAPSKSLAKLQSKLEEVRGELQAAKDALAIGEADEDELAALKRQEKAIQAQIARESGNALSAAAPREISEDLKRRVRALFSPQSHAAAIRHGAIRELRSQQVEVEARAMETGERGTLTMDAGDATESLTRSRQALRSLLDCLGK